MFYSGASGEFSGRVSRFGWDRYEKNFEKNQDAFRTHPRIRLVWIGERMGVTT